MTVQVRFRAMLDYIVVEGLELFMVAHGSLVRSSPCGDMIPRAWIIERVDQEAPMITSIRVMLLPMWIILFVFMVVLFL